MRGPDASAMTILGVRYDSPDYVVVSLGQRLGMVATLWPLACASLAAMSVLLGVGAHATGLSLPFVIAILLMIASASVLWFAAFGQHSDRWPVFQRVRVTGVAALSIGGALAVLAADLPHGSFAIVCWVSIAATIALVALALQPIRIATLSLAVGFSLMPAAAGHILATLAALPFVIAFGFVIVRLARIDARTAYDHMIDSGNGRLALKMIAEFEDHGTGWFWESDRQGRLTYLSRKVADDLVQNGQPHPIGQFLTDVFRMDGAAIGTERTLAFHLSSRTAFADYMICGAGDAPEVAERWWSMSGRPMIDDLGRFGGFIGSGSDLTEKRRSDAEITRLALFDSLTGLANRQRMRHSLDKTLQQQAITHSPAALFLMDLDRFKAVNDTLGHQAGDELLKQVAQRLQRIVGDAGLVGRLGGDEFQVLLPGNDRGDALALLARDLIAGLSQPYFVAATSVTIGCSIGIAIAPQDGKDAEALIRNADLALYAAKADGRGVHRFYSDDMLAGAKSRKALEDDMRLALTEGGFVLHYQPVVSTKDAKIVGYEALIRWHHPVRGPISPADFIPVAEECGLIEPLGEWVLRTACADAARWPGDVRVAVNVSPIQFANPAFPALVTSALAHSGLPARRLELEITEGVFLAGSGSTDAMFKALKAIGVRLALDDLGTGYSSLGYLRTAPFDKIKIDQSFVRGAAAPGNRNAAIIRAIVSLAETLGMETTAEGVEIQDEIDLVRDLGCSHIQGYVYGRGVPAADVMAQLGEAAPAHPVGHRISRAPRTRMLRSARIEIGRKQGDVRIRNMSSSGALIDGINIDGEAVGVDVMLEVAEDMMVAARIAWAHDGRAGIAFNERIDLDRLSTLQNRLRHG
ncbi:EAL domain-containing protein [Sphingomonas sp. TX0522]|nr:EAL domain-containing protein [Sphingomonas sp. TX0522]MBI0531552.1 EAL domain-containing protein [Sphingomonas sp. TX0522]